MIIRELRNRISSGVHELVHRETTEAIIGAFYEVYNTLGFGFLEHIYVMALERELMARGHHVAREVGVRVMYKGDELATQRLDMIVEPNPLNPPNPFEPSVMDAGDSDSSRL